ncbi:hypothetical protein V7S43_006607 [Phytophthora oleae]|uniref:Lipoxygenase domain-containing protein n=1 Tax=Phytophthora oleae TaxID=2107226 RepID=A0ABD3FNS4_9STRA
MALDSSELNWRQVLHYVHTHVIFIPIQVELVRSMAETHPIYALLNYGVLAIEFLGNKILFSIGTNYDKVGVFGATGFLRAILDELPRTSVIRDYPAEIEERGLKHLPRSRYVKYGVKYYDIFKTFVTAYVHTYYPSKRSIQTDPELQTWASRCSALQGINDFPSSF